MVRAFFLFALMLAGAALTAAGGAAAQPIGSRLGPPGKAAVIPQGNLSAADTARVTIIDFSTCILKRDRKRVLAALALFPSAAAENALSKLAADECLSEGEARFNSLLFRGALYISLYREQFGRQMPVLPAQSADYRAGALEPLDAVAGQAIGLREFGECVVRADPATAHAIVVAKIGSAEETRLFTVLGPLLGPCLNEGLQVKFSKTVISGLLAEILYRDLTEGSATPGATP